jgi:hypothetical protein
MTKVWIAATITSVIACFCAATAIQQLQNNERLLSRRVTALERELWVSNGYKVDRWRALASADGGTR